VTVGDNAEKAEQVIDKAAGLVDDKTGGKHGDKIDGAVTKAKNFVEKIGEKK
jgi:hypothetical protein